MRRNDKIFVAILGFLLLAVGVRAQNSNLWFYTGGQLKPNVSTWGVTIGGPINASSTAHISGNTTVGGDMIHGGFSYTRGVTYVNDLIIGVNSAADQFPSFDIKHNNISFEYQGPAAVNDSGGGIQFAANAGGSSSGAGGGVTFLGGNGAGGDSDGGYLEFVAGNKHGAGETGELRFKSGDSADYALLDTSLITTERNFQFPDHAGVFCISGVSCIASSSSAVASSSLPGFEVQKLFSSNLFATTSVFTFDNLTDGVFKFADSLNASTTLHVTGNTTLGNATSTNLQINTLTVGSDKVVDITGSGLNISSGALTLDRTGDWTGTFDGQEGVFYLARANHTGTQAASTVTGGTFGAGNFVFPSTLSVTGPLNASSTAHIDGNVSLGKILSSLNASSTAHITGNTTLSHATSTDFKTNTLTVNGDKVVDITGTGLSIGSGSLNVGGLTTSQFTSANVSQWTNDAGYLTSSSAVASSSLPGFEVSKLFAQGLYSTTTPFVFTNFASGGLFRFAQSLNASSTVHSDGALGVAGLSTLAGANLSGVLNASSTAHITGSTSIGGTFNASSTAHIDKSLFVQSGSFAYPAGGYSELNLSPTVSNINETTPVLRAINASPSLTYTAPINKVFALLSLFQFVPTLTSGGAIGAGSDTLNLAVMNMNPTFDGTIGPRTANQVFGIFLQPRNSGGSVSDLEGIRSGYVANGGIVRTGMAMRAAFPTVSGAGGIGNNYALYIDSSSSVGTTSNYAINQAGIRDLNYFLGPISSNTTTPWGQLSVSQWNAANTASSTKPIFDIASSGTSTPFIFTSQKGMTGIGTSTAAKNDLNARLVIDNGYLVLGGTTPIVHPITTTGCGSGATIVGSDQVGRVTIGTTPGTSCRVTFNLARTHKPVCTLTNETSSLAARAVDASATTTGFVITVNTAFVADTIGYHCLSY